MFDTRYPTPQATDSGSKVSWNYYKDQEDAIKAARTAEKEAHRLMMDGYDFGFQCPGDISLIREGEHQGMYRVTLP